LQEPGEIRISTRPQPSAIFVGTEAAARRNWLVNPYNSSFGNGRV